jgi:DNA-binding CsgD family transcriptional regulator
MAGKKRSKEMFTKELRALRRRVAELEREKHLQGEIEKEKATTQHSLRERVKELNCLFGVAEVIERYGSSLEKILQGITDLLPDSSQYPETTCARVIFEDNEYVTSNFKTTKWKLAADIKVSGKKMGMVEVYYLKERPILDEDPFLKEERLLIDAIAERIGRAAERIQAQKQLEVEQVALKNMNIALREVLARVQDEKKEIGDGIQANVDKIIMPLLHALETEVLPERRQYLVLLKRNLEEIVSPFTNKLSKEFMILTPVEVQTCNMIKNGLSTKEIAKLRGISPATVSRHREHIRKKLGITNKKVNLATYLSTLMAE